MSTSYEKCIPESILSALYSFIAPKESVISIMQNISLFTDNASVYMNNQKTQSVLHENLSAFHGFHSVDVETSNTELSNRTTINEISKFLADFNVKISQIIKFNSIKPQFELILKNEEENLGLQLCFASFIQSLPMIASFLLKNHAPNQVRSCKSFAAKAIEFIKNYNLPSLFIPNFDVPPFLSIPVNSESPITPTAIATSSTMLYVGGETHIRIIPLHRLNYEDPIEIPVPTPNEPYSLVYLNGLLLFSSPSTPAICIADPLENSTFPLDISYRGHFFSQSYTFSHPIITDGQFLYSIEYGTAPRIKVFKFYLDGVLFDRVITLQPGKWALKAPFKELLPLKQKDIASVATNGVFISFLLDCSQNNVTICRTFRVRDGIHVHDEILQAPANINAWVFDINRPAHCLILDRVMLMIDSEFTLPTWFVGLDMSSFDSKTLSNTSESIIENFSAELAVYASYFIGATKPPPLDFSDIPGIEKIEECICYFIDTRNVNASQAFLIFLTFIISNGEFETSRLIKILEKFVNCFSIEEYSFLKHQIAFAFLSSFDIFAQSSLEYTMALLIEIIEAKHYSSLLFKYLPKATLLAKTMSTKSLEGLCELALDTEFIHQTDAISLLIQLQYELAVNKNPLFSRYVQIILDQFNSDLSHLLKDEWSEPRFTSCVSFNVYKDLLLVIEASHRDFEFPLKQIIDFFIIGCINCQNLKPIISRIIERSLFISFEIFLFMIEKDTSFYKLDSLSTNFTTNQSYISHSGRYSNIKNVNNSNLQNSQVKFDDFSIDSKLVEEFKTIVNNSYSANLDEKNITKEINIIFDMVRTGKISNESFLEKCHQITPIQPQLFSNIARFFKSNEKIELKDPYDSSCVKFVSMFSSSIYQSSANLNVVFTYFVPRLFRVRHYFLMVPRQILHNFVLHFELWYLLMPEILSQVPITIEMLESIDTKALLYVEHTLFNISSSISYFTPKINGNDLLRSLILSNIAISMGNIPDYDFLELSINCLMSGDYEIIKQILMMILNLIEKMDLGIIDKCLEFIGTFLNEEKIMFYYQPDRLKCFQNCFLIADYLRAIIHKVPHYFKRLPTINPTYAQILGLFIVMNNSFDVIRLYCNVSSISSNGQSFSGIITYFDDKNISIETHDHSIAYISLIGGYEFTFSGLYYFDPDIITDLLYIKDLILNFKTKLNFHDIFKYASLNEFMKLERFRSLITENEIEIVASRITRTLVPINKFINDFNQLMVFHMTNLPVFLFNKSIKELQVTSLLPPTIETIHNSFFNKTQQKDIKELTISDVLTGYESSAFYVSTPIHPNVATRISFDVHSNNEYEPHLVLTIYMLGKSPGSYYMSQPVICDSSASPSIEIRPHLHSILIRTLTIHDINVFMQPACEFIYISARVASSTIVDYTFQYDLGISTISTSAEISIPRYCSSEDSPLPFQMSSIFIDAQMQDDSNNIVSHYAMNIIHHFPHFECTHQFIPFALLHADKNPFDTNVDIKRFKRCKFTEFAENALLLIRDNPIYLQKYVRSLLKDIEKKRERYIKSGFGSRNMSATVFSDEISSPVNNSYVIVRGNLYLNPAPQKIKGFGILYVIPTNDITDSLVEFIVRIRHAAAILLMLSNSNSFLVEHLTELIRLINDASLSYSPSLETLINVMNRLIPKHCVLEPRLTSSPSQSSSTSGNSSKGSFYIKVTSLDSESRSILNFSENPMSSIKRPSISEFNIELENEIQSPSSSFSLNNDLLNELSSSTLVKQNSNSDFHASFEALSLKEWVSGQFPLYFQDNVDNLDAQVEMFFTMKNSLKCFPLTNFLEQLFYSSSQVNVPSFPQNSEIYIVPFEYSQKNSNEFIYFYIEFSNDINSTNNSTNSSTNNSIIDNVNNNVHSSEELMSVNLVFEISLNSDFTDNVSTLKPNSPYIFPPTNFYIRIKTMNSNLPEIHFRKKHFQYNENTFYSKIINEVFKWEPCFSHQLLLTFSETESMTPESFSFLPLSSMISYDIACFYLSILRKKPKFVDHHTLNFVLPKIHLVQNERAVLSIVPCLSFMAINKYEPKNSEEAAVIAAILCSTPQILNYSIPFKFWREICTEGTPSNLIFKGVTKITTNLEPMFLKIVCTNCSSLFFNTNYLNRSSSNFKINLTNNSSGIHSNSNLMSLNSVDDFISLDVIKKHIVWKNVSDEIKEWINHYLQNLKPFILCIFLECVTGHWGTNSLLACENPFIFICGIEKVDVIEIHQTIQTLAVGSYERKETLINSLNYEINQFLITNYKTN
ncbi:hypothetical protein TRFO_07044 [Tritrichomonas foetus]|uniref:Uncharacterized protein n=1 Tax=Tritrichomonas foetus TaxID=1144522 RepID=A0A1J4JYP4_9EUKA|nr:hypothetical protein TRFO_07044 [Tritrichomonas foetus]|eukprot:OHT02622.1 hypothetical protein TRFO_07044 [Tritrichomonas foetus]